MRHTLNRMVQPLLRALALSLLLGPGLLAASLPAGAQTVSRSAKSDMPATDAAQKAAVRLDKLFERLKEAENANAAKTIAADIERALEHSGSATADLIYQRAKEAMAAKDFDLAIDLLDYVTLLRPEWAEPYHRRAIIHFVRKDQDAAFRDVRETLAREPRHYHALAGLGGILKGLGDNKGAFKAFSRAMDIYPHFSDLKESIEKMRPEVEGQPI